MVGATKYLYNLLTTLSAFSVAYPCDFLHSGVVECVVKEVGILSFFHGSSNNDIVLRN